MHAGHLCFPEALFYHRVMESASRMLRTEMNLCTWQMVAHELARHRMICFTTGPESPEETQTVPLLQGPDKDEVREAFISHT